MVFQFIPVSVLLAALLGPAAVWAAVRPGQGSGEFSLRSHVEVASAVVRLGNLLAPRGSKHADLPPDADRVLALSPEPGSPQIWRRQQIRQRLIGAGLDASQFEIPAQLVITRQAAPVAEGFVLAALAAHLGHPVAAADVDYTAPLTSVPERPGIVVTGSSLDARRGGLDVRCRASNDPHLLPFMVFVRLPASELASLRTTPMAVLAAQQQKPELVHPGQIAELDIHGAAFALHAEVMPLQSGRAGDHVRAVSLATHAILEVEVVDRNRVRVLSGASKDSPGLSGGGPRSRAELREAWHAQ